MVFKNGQGKTSPLLIALLVFLAISLIYPQNPLTSVLTNFGKSTTTTTTTTTNDGIKTSGVLDLTCPDKTQGVTMTLGPLVRKGQSTSVSTESVWPYVAGIDQGIRLGGSTMTVSPGVQVSLIYAPNSTVAYAAKHDLTVPCQPFSSAEINNPNKLHELVFNSSLTTNVFNPSNGNLNAAADNESLTAGEIAWFKIEAQGDANAGFSPYGKMIWVLDLNTTDVDEGNTQIIWSDGKALPRVSVPAGHPNPGTNFVSQAYEVPGCGLDASGNIQTCVYSAKLLIDADDTINPGPDTGAGLGNFNISQYDQDWFRDPYLPVHKFGAEDQNGNLTGQTTRVGNVLSKNIIQIFYI